MRRLLVTCVLVAAGCGTDPTAGPTSMPAPGDPRRCDPAVMAVPDEGRVHVTMGTHVDYKANPPASGPHWPSPHDWGVFLDQAIPRESWVHNLEHGGVVFTLNCPMGHDGGGAPDASAAASCADVANALQFLHDERKPDKYNEVRVLATLDPLSPRKVAAIAWDWVWLGDSADLQVMRCFRDARYGQGPEDAP